ncbi:MAG: hypothetical protein LRY71_09655 [Bacillaceae bacterium]|nr:hypothetical protein [Bacillaceae bacterium]
MIVYFGVLKKVEDFSSEIKIQNDDSVVSTIGHWLTSDLFAAKPYAIGTETVLQKSETDFWDDGEPKVIQVDKPVYGVIYKLFLDEPNLKVYDSTTVDSYGLFMNDRDNFL